MARPAASIAGIRHRKLRQNLVKSPPLSDRRRLKRAPVARKSARRRVWHTACDVSRIRAGAGRPAQRRSEEHTSELQSLMRISYDVFCLTQQKKQQEEL